MHQETLIAFISLPMTCAHGQKSHAVRPVPSPCWSCATGKPVSNPVPCSSWLSQFLSWPGLQFVAFYSLVMPGLSMGPANVTILSCFGAVGLSCRCGHFLSSVVSTLGSWLVLPLASPAPAAPQHADSPPLLKARLNLQYHDHSVEKLHKNHCISEMKNPSWKGRLHLKYIWAW